VTYWRGILTTVPPSPTGTNIKLTKQLCYWIVDAFSAYRKSSNSSVRKIKNYNERWPRSAGVYVFTGHWMNNDDTWGTIYAVIPWRNRASIIYWPRHTTIIRTMTSTVYAIHVSGLSNHATESQREGWCFFYWTVIVFSAMVVQNDPFVLLIMYLLNSQ
jgi:hypothetical protein